MFSHSPLVIIFILLVSGVMSEKCLQDNCRQEEQTEVCNDVIGNKMVMVDGCIRNVIGNGNIIFMDVRGNVIGDNNRVQGTVMGSVRGNDNTISGRVMTRLHGYHNKVNDRIIHYDDDNKIDNKNIGVMDNIVVESINMLIKNGSVPGAKGMITFYWRKTEQITLIDGNRRDFISFGVLHNGCRFKHHGDIKEEYPEWNGVGFLIEVSNPCVTYTNKDMSDYQLTITVNDDGVLTYKRFLNGKRFYMPAFVMGIVHPHGYEVY